MISLLKKIICKKNDGKYDLLATPPAWLVVGVPTLVVVIYLSLIASERYTATSQFIIKQSGNQNPPMALGLSFLGTQTSTSREDALIVKDFIHSYDLMRILDQRLSVMSHYADPTLDDWQALETDALEEDKIKYFRKAVNVLIDPESSIVTLTTKAFSPEMAAAMSSETVQASEDFINAISESLASSQVGFVEQEVSKSEAKLARAQQKTLKFQSKYNLIDPESETISLFSRISELEAKLSQKQTELRTLEGFLQKDSPRIASVVNEIQALQKQIQEETRFLAGDEDLSMNQILAEYQELKIEQEFALNSYTSTLASLEAARTDAARQMKYLIPISESGLPEKPSGPKPLRGAITTLLIAGLIYFSLRLTIATINDHRN